MEPPPARPAAEVARAVVDRLISAADTPYPGAANRTNPPVPCRYFACDTEVWAWAGLGWAKRAK